MDMSKKMGWPDFGADQIVLVGLCFDMPTNEVQDVLSNIMAEFPPLDDHDLWDDYDPVNDFSELAKRWGLPSNPKYHQQPYDLVRLFPMPLRSYASDDESEIIVNRMLLPLFLFTANQLSEGRELTEVLIDLRSIVFRLVRYFGDGNSEIRTFQFQYASEWFDWFTYTAGCFDVDSGVLIDRETPALREFEAAIRRDSNHSRLEGDEYE